MGTFAKSGKNDIQSFVKREKETRTERGFESILKTSKAKQFDAARKMDDFVPNSYKLFLNKLSMLRPASFEPKPIEPRTFAPEVRELLERATAPPPTNLATNELDHHKLDDYTATEKEPETDLVATSPAKSCSSVAKASELVGGVRHDDRALEPPPRWPRYFPLQNHIQLLQFAYSKRTRSILITSACWSNIKYLAHRLQKSTSGEKIV